MVYLARLLLHLYDLCPRLFVESCNGEQLTKSVPQGVLACSVVSGVALLAAQPPSPPLQSVCTPHVLTSSSPITCLLLAHTLGSASGASGVGYKSVSGREDSGL